MSPRKILTISLTKEIYNELDDVSREERMPRSRLLRMAISDLLGRLKWEKALRYGRKKAKELKITENDIEEIVHGFRKK